MDLVFSNCTVLTNDGENAVLTECDVGVNDGVITELGRSNSRNQPQRLVDASDLLILPGLINSHTHSPENFSKGRAESMTLGPWLDQIWPALDVLEPRQIYIAALLGAAEMLHTGTISVVDHFRQTPMNLAAVHAVAEGYRDSGMRAVIAVMLRDIPQFKGQLLPSATDQIGIVEQAHLNCDTLKCSKVRIALGPSAPTRCTEKLLISARDLALRHGLYLHTHIDETTTDAAEAHKQYGKSSVQHLANLDLLTPFLSLAHGVWLNSEDFELLAAAGSTVVHNPVSNMRLGSGIAPLTALREHGVSVALGSDGAASNDGQDMFEALKAAVLLQRVAGVEAKHWITAKEALPLVTSTPARVFGFGTGQITIGAPADFIAINRSGYSFTPQNDWHRQLVFGGNGLKVRYAVVAGKLLLDDERITTFDEENILAEAREIGMRIYTKPGDHVV